MEKLKKGFFITFEGTEGCGKTTHSKKIYNFLKKKYRTTYVREPGGTKISNRIREILLNVENKQMSDRTELLLFLASRSQLVREVISPALDKKEIVICDRFLDSTFAYQIYGRKLSQKLVRLINSYASYGLTPDITILLNEEVKKGIKRVRKRNRMENEKISFHYGVKRGYLKLARSEPRRIKVIDVLNSVESTHKRILGTLLDELENYK